MQVPSFDSSKHKVKFLVQCIKETRHEFVGIPELFVNITSRMPAVQPRNNNLKIL